MFSGWQFVFSLLLILSFVCPSNADARKSGIRTAVKSSNNKSKSGSGPKHKPAKSDAHKKLSTKVGSKRAVAGSSSRVIVGSSRREIAGGSNRAVGKRETSQKRHVKLITRTTIKVTAKKRKTQVARAYFWNVPMDTTPLNPALSSRMNANFQRGLAGRYSPQDLVRARVFAYSPLRGGMRPRTELVSNLIIHSTETASPADARTVVKSWNHGLRHPGTQYIVDRDGTIHQTVDPRFATVHVNEKRTLGGVTNDNSIGIEIVRSGKQKYTATQLASVVRLVDYIRDRYPIRKVWGHGQIQPSTRTDPVAFNWTLFSRNLALINSATTQTAYKASVRQGQG